MTLPSKNSLLERKFLRKDLHDTVIVEKAFTTSPSTPLLEALRIMCEHNIGSILLTEGDALKGIFTERDLIKRIACMTHPPANVVMRDVMTKNPQTISIRASIARAIHALSVGGYRHLPVVGKQGEPIKILSVKDIIHFIEKHVTSEIVKADTPLSTGKGEFDMFFYDDVRVLHSPPAHTALETETVQQGMEKLCKADGGCIVVLNAQEHITGVFTERDYMKKVVLGRLDMQQTKMHEVMTKSPQTILSNASVALAVNTLSEGNFRHIPIVDSSERLTGLLSVKHLFHILAERILTDLAPHPDSPK